MPDSYTCGKCGKVAKTKQALERHAAYHEDDRPFSCEVCLQRFKNSDDRGKHYRRLKRDGKYAIACQVCHKHFKTAELLNKHVEMLGCQSSVDVIDVSADTDPGIDVSDATNSKTDLSVTIKEESLPGDGVSCTCKICEVEFTGISVLKAHYKHVHNDSKKQVCIQCGQTLSSKDSLARHFSIFHQTSFPYSCEICNQKFKIKESLCRHVKFVHQDGGYQCPECQRMFTQPVNLKKHMAVHSTEKEHVCGVCHREFRWKQALQKHEALHNERKVEKISTNDKNLACELKSDEYEELDVIEDEVDLHETGKELEDFSQKGVDKGAVETNTVDESLNVLKDSGFSDEASGNLKLRNGTSSVGTDKTIMERSNIKNSCKIAEKVEPLDVRVKAKQMTGRYDFLSDDDPDLDDYDKNSVESLASLNRKRISSESLQNKAANKKTKLSETATDLSVHVEAECIDVDEIEHHSDADDSDMDTIVGSPDATTDKSIIGTSDVSTKGTTNVNMENENSENNHSAVDNEEESIPHGYSTYTSFPTSTTQNAPRLVFKPSSIQNIMSKPSQAPKLEKLSGKQTLDNETNPVQGVQKHSKTKMKFPNKLGTLGQNLHNPFLIQDIRRSPVQVPTSPVNASHTNSDSKSSSFHIPGGKFSMVKHMLSLKNEDNFDKAVFENPLYNSLPEVKDLKLLVERHKITQKSDDCVTEKYDLSAKQNIPFHWLGMSVAMRKAEPSPNGKSRTDDLNMNVAGKVNVISDVNEKNGVSKEAEGTSAARNDESKGNTNRKVCTEQFSMFKNSISNTVKTIDIDKDRGKEKLGFQAIKSLVALKKQSEGHSNLVQSSVLSNPFVNQSPDIQVRNRAGILAQNDTLTVAECLTMLKRSTSVIDAMACVQDSSLAKPNCKPALAVNQTLLSNHDANFVCNSRLNATSLNCGEHSNVACSDSLNISPSSPRGFPNTQTSLSLATSSSIGSSTTAKPYCVTHFSRSVSVPAFKALSPMSSSTMSASSALQRYGSEPVPCGTDKSSYLKSNHGYDLPNSSTRGPSCHLIEKRRSMEYGSINAAAPNISSHGMPFASTGGIGLHTSWSSQPRLTPQTDSQRHHPAVSLHNVMDEQTFAQLPRLGRTTSMTSNNTRYGEDNGCTNSASFFSSRANSYHSLKKPTSDIFDVLDYSMPSKIDSHNSSMPVKTPAHNLTHAHSIPMWTKHGVRMPGCEKNIQRQDSCPSVLDFSLKYNASSVSNEDNLEDNSNIRRSGFIEGQPSQGQRSNDNSNISIFDILKGPADRPRQLENVDNLLDAYV